MVGLIEGDDRRVELSLVVFCDGTGKDLFVEFVSREVGAGEDVSEDFGKVTLVASEELGGEDQVFTGDRRG